jgi:hypothetical protein
LARSARLPRRLRNLRPTSGRGRWRNDFPSSRLVTMRGERPNSPVYQGNLLAIALVSIARARTPSSRLQFQRWPGDPTPKALIEGRVYLSGPTSAVFSRCLFPRASAPVDGLDRPNPAFGPPRASERLSARARGLGGQSDLTGFLGLEFVICFCCVLLGHPHGRRTFNCVPGAGFA